MHPWLHSLVTLIIIVTPVAVVVWLRRGRRVPWFHFCVGILTFLGSQVVHLPLNKLLTDSGVVAKDLESGSLYLTAIVLGLTAGVTEEAARAIGYALVRRARRYEDGLMMGLGHGGIEAMIIGVLAAANFSALWLAKEGAVLPIELTPEQSATLHQQVMALGSAPQLALLPLVERLIALTLHASLSIMVLMAFVRRQWLYVAAAIVIHATVDFAVVVAATEMENTWLVEGLFALTVAPIAIWAWRQARTVQRAEPSQAPAVRRQISLLGVALNKELRYQWRTKRLLVVCGVFLVFGMISPLLAEFTPQLLGSIEGAEQFADLIPEPTVNDAIGQYLKNITQFGFLLAILLGMGAVAAEKEKGTAAMILSKPLPRWAFLGSKFLSQAAVYAIGFALAAVAAYYYTVFLFESIAFLPFVYSNLLLFAWLLVFVAVTLMGSSLGKSTAAAAGWAAVGAVVLLIAGSIPKYGALAPSGLVSWAGQLALDGPGAPNGGALAMSLVLILVSLVAGLAAFESQEI